MLMLECSIIIYYSSFMFWTLVYQKLLFPYILPKYIISEYGQDLKILDKN